MNLIIPTHLQQRVILSTGIICALLTVYLIGYSLWRWHADWVIAQSSAPTAPQLNATDETAMMIAGIPDAHLFGQTFSKSGEVPLSDLQLRVTGIVKETDETNANTSKAYISISGQPSKIFQIGDSLPYGVKVYDITSDAVILENGGRLEKLPLPREKLQFKPLPPREEN